MINHFTTDAGRLQSGRRSGRLLPPHKAAGSEADILRLRDVREDKKTDKVVFWIGGQRVVLEPDESVQDAGEPGEGAMTSEPKTWTYAELTAITEQEIERLRLEVEKTDDMPRLQRQSALAAYVTYRFWVTLVGDHYDWLEEGERLESLVSRCFDSPLPAYLIGSGIRSERKRKDKYVRYEED
jgi:hypothetical protein